MSKFFDAARPHFYIASPGRSLPGVQATAMFRKTQTFSVSLSAGTKVASPSAHWAHAFRQHHPTALKHKVNGGCHPARKVLLSPQQTWCLLWFSDVQTSFAQNH